MFTDGETLGSWETFLSRHICLTCQRQEMLKITVFVLKEDVSIQFNMSEVVLRL